MMIGENKITAIGCQEYSIDYSSLVKGDSLLYVERKGQPHAGVYGGITIKESSDFIAEGILHLHNPKGPHVEMHGIFTTDKDGYYLELDGDAECLRFVGSLAEELRNAKIDSEKKRVLKQYIESEEEARLR